MKSFILKRKGVVPQPQRLGHHLRNRRLVLGLTQDQVAAQLGTVREVYERWERNQRQPVVSVWPSILAFLGYYPDTGGASVNLTLMARRRAGLDQKRLAKKIDVIHQRLRDWEHERQQPSKEQVRRLKEIAEAAIKGSRPATSS